MKRVLAFIFWIILGGASLLVVGVLLSVILPSFLTRDRPLSRNELETVAVSDVEPTGEVAQAFSMFSGLTSAQKDAIVERLKGKVIRWTLPLREASTTSNRMTVTLGGDSKTVRAQCVVTDPTSTDKERVGTLPVGKPVTFRGVIDGPEFLDGVRISPSILVWN